MYAYVRKRDGRIYETQLSVTVQLCANKIASSVFETHFIATVQLNVKKVASSSNTQSKSNGVIEKLAKFLASSHLVSFQYTTRHSLKDHPSFPLDYWKYHQQVLLVSMYQFYVNPCCNQQPSRNGLIKVPNVQQKKQP